MVMKNKKTLYLKTDDNKIVNKTHIRWVKQMSECLEVCIRSNGCTGDRDTHRICKLYNPDSYNALHKHFE